MAGMTASGDFDPDETFYEDDRPLSEVLGAYERGVKGMTARPIKFELSASPLLQAEPSSKAWPASVSWKASAPRPIEVASPARVA